LQDAVHVAEGLSDDDNAEPALWLPGRLALPEPETGLVTG
jgi:hypothetical protein